MLRWLSDDAAKANRYGPRDAVLLTYRHGLRASELETCVGTKSTSIARRWRSAGPRMAHLAPTPSGATSCGHCVGWPGSKIPKSPFVFTSERGAPFTTAGFARMVERAGAVAGFEFKAHPHMLRHACGFALANKGHDTRSLQAYLGHRNIQHTVRYTELSPDRFKDFWR
jgi:integrase